MEIEEIVLNVLKYALFGIKEELPDGIDWAAVYKELRTQTVQNLICPVLGELPDFTEDDKQRWIQSAGVSVPYYFKILKTQQDTIELLEKSGIRSVVLKGSAAAMYYPYPEYRCMGDIDLLIEKGRAKEASELLLSGGYKLDSPLEHSTRHYNLRRNGVEIEVHIHFSSFEDEKLSAYLDDMLFEAMNNPETVKSFNYSFPVLPALQNGVVLLCHINHHLCGGLGLRQIIDWLMFADRYLDDDYWSEHFQPVAAELGLEKMAMVFTRIGQMYLGFPQEGHSWCMAADENLCNEILNYIFRSGNFGRKIGAVNLVNATFIEMKDKNIFRILQSRGEYNFSDRISAHPWIKPFIWIPQGLRTVKRGLQVINNAADLKKSQNESRERIDLMDRIGYQK